MSEYVGIVVTFVLAGALVGDVHPAGFDARSEEAIRREV